MSDQKPSADTRTKLFADTELRDSYERITDRGNEWDEWVRASNDSGAAR